MAEYALIRLGMVAVLFVGVRLASAAVHGLRNLPRCPGEARNGKACSAQ